MKVFLYPQELYWHKTGCRNYTPTNMVFLSWKERLTQVRLKSPAESPEDYTHTLKPDGGKYDPYPPDFRTIMATS